ncbi:right-handed parallel beta-helix repeat-containing protein, partial [bacterium]|nr:right-handed parallel beta-helix repeat-containing protein [bacterium]
MRYSRKPGRTSIPRTSLVAKSFGRTWLDQARRASKVLQWATERVWARFLESRPVSVRGAGLIEQLEQRTVLSANFWVNDNWAITSDVGTIGLSIGDIVANTNAGDDGTITGKQFGLDAFSTINAAIIPAVDGDTIHVINGTYTETLAISEDLSILRQGADFNLNAGGAFTAITILPGANVTIDGVDVSNFISTAIDLQSGSAIDLSNATTSGGFVGINNNGGVLEVTSSRVENALILGINVGGGGSATIAQSEVRNNGAIGIIVSSGFADIDNSIITGNNRGVLVNATGTASITGSNLLGNSVRAIENATSTIVDASGNWWGTVAESAISSQVLGLVDYSTYLASGVDGNGALPGFIASFDDLYVTTLGSQSGIVGRVQEGINLVNVGGTVRVNAGTYVENVTVNKSVTLRGQQYGVDARTRAVSPSLESVILTPVSGPNPNTSPFPVLINVTSSNVTIDGFLLDGDNPGLTSGVIRNGADIDAEEGISSYAGVGHVTASNNIIRNVSYSGITFYNYDNGGAATGDNIISRNRIENLGAYDWGIGVLVYNDFYAQITDNKISDVRVGIQTGNYNDPNPGAAATIGGNQISARGDGIFYNLHYQNASPWSLLNNTITATLSGAQPGDVTFDSPLDADSQWSGITISSQQNSVTATISGNVIDGSGTDRTVGNGHLGSSGYVVWNTPTTGGLTITGGSVQGVDYGVWVNNYEGYLSDAGNTSVALGNLSISAGLKGVWVYDSPLNTNNAQVSATILPGTAISTTSATGTGVEVSGSQAQLSVTGGSITDNAVGVRVIDGSQASLSGITFDGSTDNARDVVLAGSAGTVTFGPNNQFAGDDYFIENLSSQSFDLSSLSGTTYEAVGLPLLPIVLADAFQIEDRMYHRLDSPTSGLIRVVGGQLYVTTPGTGLSNETIQRAVDAASVGNTIYVEAGTYVENVLVNKNVTLLSQSGRSATTIQGISGLGALGTIVVTGGTTDFNLGGLSGEGFKVIGIDNNVPGIENAAVYFQGSHSNADIRWSEIVANGDVGLLTESGQNISNFVIDNNIFSGQTFVGPNPADNGFSNQFTTPNVPRQLVVMGSGSGTTTTNNITFSNNQITGTAGGVNLGGEQGNTLVTIDALNSTFTGNNFVGTTTRFGQSLRARGANSIITNNTFNSATMGVQTTDLLVNQLGNVIQGNSFSSSAALAISIAGGSATIGGTLAGQPNTITGYDAAIAVSGAGTNASVSQNEIYGNAVGIGIATGGLATIANVDFDGLTDNTRDIAIASTAGTVTVGNNNQFAGDTYFIENLSTQNINLTATTGNSYEAAGVPLLPSVLSDAFRIEDRMYHRTDASTSGLIRLVTGEIFVTTPGTGASNETVQRGVDAASPGDTIHVEAGLYSEDVDVNKFGVKLLGAGASSTTLRGVTGGSSSSTVRITANNVELAGFTITREGNNVTDWNNPGLNLAGVSVQGPSITGLTLRDSILTGNRTGIDINNSSGHTIRNNQIVDNRTGLIFRNQTDNLTVVENVIANNWTVGVLFLDGSVGTNVPVQSALNSTFSNNSISGNWYGQVVDRQSGGSLAVPGTTNLKDFSGNWWGTNAPVLSTLNSSEPGYASQIPVIFGGTSVAPGGQPDILGSASSNIDFTSFLNVGADTNVETVFGRGTFGFQGDFSVLRVTAAGSQTGGVGRISEGVNLLPASGGVLYVLSGSYTDNVNTSSKAVTLRPGSSPGQVTLNGNIVLDGNDVLDLEINGTNASTLYDNLVVNGTVSLGGASLLVTRGFNPFPGDVFTIINNDLSDAVSGTFAGLGEGSIITLSGIPFTISYVGGTGNDVTLSIAQPSVVYVDDNWSGATVGVDQDGSGNVVPTWGGPVNGLAFGYDQFSSIQAAINAVAVGGTIYVYEGTYIQAVDVSKSVTLRGRQSGVDARTRAVNPTLESVILTPVSGPDPNTSPFPVLINVTSSNVTIDGFLLDGDNPGLTSGVIRNGADIDAEEGISSYAGVGHVTASNNIIRNVSYSGITFYNYDNGGAATGDNIISRNRIENLGAYDWGIGVLVYNDFYAQITDNKISDVRVGIQTGNYNDPNPGAAATIGGNQISARGDGIFYNLHYQNASPWSLLNNTITATLSGAQPGDVTFDSPLDADSQWSGITISSQQNSVTATISGNVIDGSGTDRTVGNGHLGSSGYVVWNTPTTGGLTITGGSVQGVDYGVWVNNYEGYLSDAGNTSVALGNLSISAGLKGVWVYDSPLNTNNAQVSATILPGTAISTTSATGTGVEVSGSQAQLSVTGGSITDNAVGVRVIDGSQASLSGITFDGSTDNARDVVLAGSAGTVTFGPNNQFAGDDYFIENLSSQSFDLSSLSGTTYEAVGLPLLPIVLADAFQIEDRMYHRLDSPTSGLIRVVGGQLYVTTPGTGLSNETIQRAVDAASVGNTIYVEAGTYVENVLVNKNVTLLSQSGRSATTIQGISGLGALGTIVVTGGTTDFNLGGLSGEGFKVIGIDNNVPGIENAAVYFQGSHSNADIRWSEIVANGDVGLLTESGQNISNFVIDNNIFSGQTFVGPNPADNGFSNQFTTPNVPRQLVVMGSGSGTTTTNNITFSNNQITGTAGGVNLGGEQGNTLVTIDALNSTFTGNNFVGTTTRFGQSLRARGANSIITNNTFNSATMGVQTTDLLVNQLGNVIQGNSFSSSAALAISIAGGSATIGGTLAGQPNTITGYDAAIAVSGAGTNASVVANTFTGNTGGIGVAGNSVTVNVANNFFINNATGVGVNNTATGSLSVIENSFTDTVPLNGAPATQVGSPSLNGLVNQSAINVNANNNWWGSVNGPTSSLNLTLAVPKGVTVSNTGSGTISIAPWISDNGDDNNLIAQGFQHNVLDVTPPPAPSIPDLIVSSDSGASNVDDVTNDSTPTFEGTAEPGSTVQVFIDSVLAGSVMADSFGNWAFTSGLLADGIRSITALAIDGSGNVGPLSGSLSILIDTVAPSPSVAGPVTVNEGDTVVLIGSPNLGGGSGLDSDSFASTVGFNAQTIPGVVGNTITFVPNDNGSAFFTYFATDIAGNSSSNNFTVTANNVVPVFASVLGSTIDENDTATVVANIVDAGTLDVFSVEVNWGEGSPDTITGLGLTNATGSIGGTAYVWTASTRLLSLSHKYLDDNPTGSPS